MENRNDITIGIRLASMLVDHFIMCFAMFIPILPFMVIGMKNAFSISHEQTSMEPTFMIYGFIFGFALYFNNFSTFLGKPGLYLEDLYVREEMRGKGIGKTLLAYLAKKAVEEDCGRFEWWCLDWNKPSIDFYLKLGAIPMDEWTVYRMCGDALVQLSREF